MPPAFGHKNALHRLFCPHRALPFDYKIPHSRMAACCNQPVTNLSCSRSSRQMVSCIQNNPFSEKGHSYPLMFLLCMRSHAQYRCREIIPSRSGLRIVSCFSPPFPLNLNSLYHHFYRFATGFLYRLPSAHKHTQKAVIKIFIAFSEELTLL